MVVRVIPDVTALRRQFDYTVPEQLVAAVEVGTEVRIVLNGRRVRAWVSAVGVQAPDGVSLRPLSAVRGVGPPAPVVELAHWAAWRWAGTPVHFLRTASSDTVVRLPPPVGRRAVRIADHVVGGARRAGIVGDGSGVDVAAAMAGGTVVVQLGPAADVTELLAAAAQLLPALDRTGPSGGAGGAEHQNAGVLVLVPEARQVAPMAAFCRSLGAPVAVLPEQWALARRGGCIAVGTRAAAWAPLPALAAALVFDAHDESLVEQRAPTWAAPAVVAERARRAGAPCVLVSPCPTLELAALGSALEPDRRHQRLAWPPVEVLDLRAADPRQGLLSTRAVELARWAVASPGRRRIICVINRTGGARLVLCGACGDVARCEDCGGALELTGEGPAAAISRQWLPGPAMPGHEGSGLTGPGGAGERSAELVCQRCGSRRPVVCARCGSTATKALRLGVSRLRQELEVLAGGSVVELTAADGEALPVGATTAAVLVGTDAALRRGLMADAVVLLDLDGDMLGPRMRAAEQSLALVARAARAVRQSALPGAHGRAPGRLVIQTRQPSHAVVRAAVAGDPSLLQGEEMAVRRSLRLPPTTAMAQVSGVGASPMVDALREALANRAFGSVELDGPFEGRWTLRAPEHGVLCDLLASVTRPAGRVRVEVDPQRL